MKGNQKLSKKNYLSRETVEKINKELLAVGYITEEEAKKSLEKYDKNPLDFYEELL